MSLFIDFSILLLLLHISDIHFKETCQISEFTRSILFWNRFNLGVGTKFDSICVGAAFFVVVYFCAIILRPKKKMRTWQLSVFSPFWKWFSVVLNRTSEHSQKHCQRQLVLPFANYIRAKDVMIASYRPLFLSLSLSLFGPHILFSHQNRLSVCHLIVSCFLYVRANQHSLARAACVVKNLNCFYFHSSFLFCYFSLAS